MSKQILVDLAQRHCGCGFEEGLKGADFGIPIFAEHPSMMMIQVKNLSSNKAANNHSDQACRDLLPSEAFEDSDVSKSELPTWDAGCVRIYMQLGAPIPSAVCRSVEIGTEQLAKPLQLFGLGARCLSEEIRDSLRVLLCGRVDLETYLDMFEEADVSPRPRYMDLIRRGWPFVISSKTRYESKSKHLLQLLCKQRGLADSGNRKTLISLLTEYDEASNFALLALHPVSF